LSVTSQETIEHYLDQQRTLVDQELERLLPGAGEHPSIIHGAMRYSVFAGGKRLRPLLCLESGRLIGGDETSLLRAAAPIELVHTYSLIHDDLPALDNDDFRRGKPTCHRVFGEAMAILAGDALLTLAFEALAEPGAVPADRQVRVIRTLSNAIGTRGGMVAGQVVDLISAGQEGNGEQLEFIHSAKTGALIQAAVRIGGLCAGAPEVDLERVTLYGRRVGLAFQIADDLLDVVGSKEAMGKAVGKDQSQRKMTYPGLYGIEESRRMATKLVREACELLEVYGDRGERLKMIAQFLIARNS
jgi:geranylgeranyl diphosphate synthase type II